MADARVKGRMPIGGKHWNARLTDDMAREVREAHATGGVSCNQLARRFGVSRKTIAAIISGKAYRDSVIG